AAARGPPPPRDPNRAVRRPPRLRSTPASTRVHTPGGSSETAVRRDAPSLRAASAGLGARPYGGSARNRSRRFQAGWGGAGRAYGQSKAWGVRRGAWPSTIAQATRAKSRGGARVQETSIR